MIQETAKSTVILDGKQAESELKKLEDASKGYREAMEKCRKANDLAGFEKLKKEVDANSKAQAALRKELFSVEKVMQNLSGASMNQLKTAQRSITTELNKMTRGTQEYIDKSKQLKHVNAEIGKVKTEMNGAGGAGQSAWGKIGMAATKFMGIAAAAWGVIKSGQVIIESTSALSDKWAESLGGIKSGFNSIVQAVANLDFSNFWSNTKKAIETGREIARMKDELEDRKRAETVIESKYNYEIAQLKVIAATQTNSDAVRQKALQDAITKERELNDIKLSNAQLDYDTNLKNMQLESKISKDELEAFFLKFNNDEKLREQATKYNEALSNIKKTQEDLDNARKGSAKSGLGDQTAILADNLAYFQKVVEAADPKIKTYATLLSSYGKAANKTIDEFVQSFGNLYKTKEEYQANVLRLTKQETSFEKKENKNKLDNKKDTLKEQQDVSLQMLEQEYQQYRIFITEKFTTGKIQQEEYTELLMSNELSFLEDKKQLYKDELKYTGDLEEQISQKKQAIREYTYNKIIGLLDKQNNEEIKHFNEIKDKTLDDLKFKKNLGLISDEEFNIASANAEYDFNQANLINHSAYLQSKIELEQQYGQDSIATQKELAATTEQITANTTALTQEEIAIRGQAILDHFEQQQAKAKEFGNIVGSAIGEAIAGGQNVMEAAGKAMLLFWLRELKQYMQIQAVKATMGSFASWESVITWGAAGATKAAILVGLIEAAFATVSSLITAQRYSGKYDVIGADDGQSYSADYGGRMSTGVYGTPTLVGEHGDEIVIDGATTKNLMVNFPNVLPTIMAAKVPQRANGNNMNSSFQSINSNAKLEALIERQLVVTERQSLVINDLTKRLNKGINAKINYTHMKDGLTKGQAAEDRGSRSS